VRLVGKPERGRSITFQKNNQRMGINIKTFILQNHDHHAPEGLGVFPVP
jgi:hypothetical protein